MPQALVNIVIVNFNAGGLLRECLESVIRSRHANFVVHVVDNASTDDSLEDLPGDNRIVVLRQAQNVGFAKGVNIGLRAKRADWYLILNPDTRIAESTLEESIAYMTQHPRIGVMGAGHTNESGELVPSNARIPSPLQLFLSRIGVRRPLLFGAIKPVAMVDQDLSLPAVVDQVMGAFMFTRGEIINDLKILKDEDYFVYYEDMQFCYDVKKAGYEVFYNPNIRIFHLGQGTTRNIKATRLVYSVRSSILFADKNFGPLGQATTRIAAYAIEPLTRLLGASLSSDREKEVAEWWEAYQRIWKLK